MSRNSIITNASPTAVFAVLDDPYAYPRWVVGARRVRAVDPSWPSIGSRFHHALGTPAAELHDSSKILERDPPRRLLLEVRFRPTGIATVAIDVRAHGPGTVITIEEHPTDGPVAHVPRWVIEPVLGVRNAIALRRLRREVQRASSDVSVP